MKLRAPAIPLITIDPYFTVWSPDETLNYAIPQHWSGLTQTLVGLAVIDSKEYTFFGYHRDKAKMKQVSLDIDALSTTVVMETEEIFLTAKFTSPVILNDLEHLTRPVSYLNISYKSKDGKNHDVKIDISASDELCLMKRGQYDIVKEDVEIGNLKGTKFGSVEQKPLNKSGDDICIDWGYFYLLTNGKNVATSEKCFEGRDLAHVNCDIKENEDVLYLFCYDDIYSMEYFGEKLKSYWNKDGKTLLQAADEAEKEYSELVKKCDCFSEELYTNALNAGGEKYAEICTLAYRQVIAAHKLVLDTEGNILYISKECYSNGCGATVDVSYPSTPLFLLYNPELVKGMLRPIYKYALSDAWEYDFAPHDVGQYPLLNGQVYGNNELRWQMPVEECGNMIITETNIAIATGDTAFAESHFHILTKWAKYLLEFGQDPGNQLCTDDFAGHLNHNCNLSLKAIMGVRGMGVLCEMMGKNKESKFYKKEAKRMADIWLQTAVDKDGSTRLAFDQPDTFSMKYNMVWDRVWKTKLFSQKLMDTELKSNKTHFNKYGMPLDSRADYTKSDWLVWTASMSSSKKMFEDFIKPMWNAYNVSTTRVALTDWYDTVSSNMVSFKHRTVQGGLFMKVLMDKWRENK